MYLFVFALEKKASLIPARYSLGVALWTSADYLLDEDEEPSLTVEFW